MVGCQISTDERQSETAEMPTNDIAKSVETYPCVHCDGSGRRVNQLSGTFGKCSSCDGKGKVDKYKHDHFVKEYESSSNTIPSENTYTCPQCGGLGLQTNITDAGMDQSTCTICRGTGKVNQWTYENFNY